MFQLYSLIIVIHWFWLCLCYIFSARILVYFGFLVSLVLSRLSSCSLCLSSQLYLRLSVKSASLCYTSCCTLTVLCQLFCFASFVSLGLITPSCAALCRVVPSQCCVFPSLQFLVCFLVEVSCFQFLV